MPEHDKLGYLFGGCYTLQVAHSFSVCASMGNGYVLASSQMNTVQYYLPRLYIQFLNTTSVPFYYR
jgi:hypothetical protein